MTEPSSPTPTCAVGATGTEELGAITFIVTFVWGVSMFVLAEGTIGEGDGVEAGAVSVGMVC